jgi:hypothetical protein
VPGVVVFEAVGHLDVVDGLGGEFVEEFAGPSRGPLRG